MFETGQRLAIAELDTLPQHCKCLTDIMRLHGANCKLLIVKSRKFDAFDFCDECDVLPT